MPIKYTREQIVEAVQATTCMTECLVLLGAPLTPGSRAHIWARISNGKIDTSGWRRSPRSNRLYDDAALEKAVTESVSIAGVLRLLGIRPAGGSHFHISERIKAAGLDTSHFTGQGWHRGKPGPRKAAREVLVVLPPGSTRTKSPQLVRAMLESGLAHVCRGCGIPPEWRGAALTLAVDHVNGDWLDNRLANLRFLCPNCHAQTSTWCRRKGS